MTRDSAAEFDASRAEEYSRQSRVALAGYDACRELSARVLSAALGEGQAARALVVGAGGTAGEIIAAARLEARWSFCGRRSVAADARSRADLSGKRRRVRPGGNASGAVEELDPGPSFDAAIMIGVLHHLPEEAAKREILAQIAARSRPGAPLVVAGNYP